MPQIYIIVLFGFGAFVNFTRAIHFFQLKKFKECGVTVGQLAFILFNLFVLYWGGFFNAI